MTSAEVAADQDLSAALDDVMIEEAGVEDDNELALKGVVLLLNNKWVESREMFEKYKSHSVVMHFGGAFVNYMQGKCGAKMKKVLKFFMTGYTHAGSKCRDIRKRNPNPCQHRSFYD